MPHYGRGTASMFDILRRHWYLCSHIRDHPPRMGLCRLSAAYSSLSVEEASIQQKHLQSVYTGCSTHVDAEAQVPGIPLQGLQNAQVLSC